MTPVTADTYWTLCVGEMTARRVVEVCNLQSMTRDAILSWLAYNEREATAAGAGLGDTSAARDAAADELVAAQGLMFSCNAEDGAPVDYVAANAREAAELYAADEYSADDRTIFANVRVTPAADSTAGSWHKVQIDPEEPDCDDVDHAWQDGPVRGSGGGVAYTATCAHCGLRRHIDTWGTDPHDGSQGHRVVRYSASVSA